MWMFFFSKAPEAPAAGSSLSYEAVRTYLPAGKSAISKQEAYQAIVKGILAPLAATPEFVESRYFPTAIYDASTEEANKRLFAMLTATKIKDHYVPGYFYSLDKPTDVAAAGAFANKFNSLIMPAIKRALPGHPLTIIAEVKKNDKGEDVLMFSPQLVISPELKNAMSEACSRGAATLFRYDGGDASEFTQDPIKAIASQLLGPAFIDHAIRMNFMGTLTVPLFAAQGGKMPSAKEKETEMARLYRPFVEQFNSRFAPFFSQTPGRPVAVKAAIKEGKEGKAITISFEPDFEVPPQAARMLSERGVAIKQ